MDEVSGKSAGREETTASTGTHPAKADAPEGERVAALVRELKPGTLIEGKYRIDSLLGRGGMGVVVRATHVHLNEAVALKFLSVRDDSDPEFHTRFHQEARLCAKLRNEHIARVYDVGTWQNRVPFMVMEYLEGIDLAEVITERGPIPVEQTADYVLQICEGLAEAHALGVVHRDLKPSNLFVTKRPGGSHLIKILDFGISKWARPDDGRGTLDITRTGAVLGSPKYISPEQVFGAGGVDARADIWALGAILYEMLTGRPPYDFPAFTQIIAILGAGTPPRRPTAFAPSIAPALEEVVLRCLQHDPKRRIANVADLAAALIESVGAEGAADTRAKIGAILAGEGGEPLRRATDNEPRVWRTPTRLQGTTLAMVPEDTPQTEIESAAIVTLAKHPRARLMIASCAVMLAAVGGITWYFARPEGAPSTTSLGSSAPLEPILEGERPGAGLPATTKLSGAEANARGLPRSCADARNAGVEADGAVRIDPDGAGPLHPFEVFCAGMTDGSRVPPREYVTLARGPSSGQVDANATKYVWQGGPCACPDLTLRFERVRLDLDELAIDPTDTAFAKYDRPLACEMADKNHCGEHPNLAWGGAGSCRAVGDTSGRASIDLRGTPFALAPRARFVAGGFGAAGSANVAKDRRTAIFVGGGLCGAMVPEDGKIPVVQER